LSYGGASMSGHHSKRGAGEVLRRRNPWGR